MNERLHSDICVIGGGPAGATASRRLAQLGYSVMVIEKRVFPRAHIGESLSPGVVPLMDALGIKDRMEHQGFLRPRRVLLHWPPTRGYKSIGASPGFQVDRAKFDLVLLEAAREAGARVLDGCQLLSANQHGGGWKLKISWQRKEFLADCCFVIDASGRRGVMGGRKRRYGARTLALWNYWRSCALLGDETRVEAGVEEWYWGAPLPDGSFNATVFVDSARFQEHLKRLGSPNKIYQNLLARSELLAGCLEGHANTSASVCDATCYTDEDPFSDHVNMIKVGEALFSVDPLSSQGVQTAIGTALHVAAVVNTALRHSEDWEIAKQFYRERQQDAVTFHCSTAAHLYGQVALEREGQFWQQRTGEQTAEEVGDLRSDLALVSNLTGKTKIQMAPEAQILSMPCIEGDFIVRRRGVVHLGRMRPMVFLGDVELAPLLDFLRSPCTVEETRRAWSQNMPGNQIGKILSWAWENGLIVEAS